jgi:hypothetical protein
MAFVSYTEIRRSGTEIHSVIPMMRILRTSTVEPTSQIDKTAGRIEIDAVRIKVYGKIISVRLCFPL